MLLTGTPLSGQFLVRSGSLPFRADACPFERGDFDNICFRNLQSIVAQNAYLLLNLFCNPTYYAVAQNSGLAALP